MKVLITGASGFVGTALRRRLAGNSRWLIRAASRSSSVAVDGAVEWCAAPELGPEANWHPLLAGVDVVVHLAARVHVMHEAAGAGEQEFQRINVAGTRTLAEQVAASGVRRLVFVSSVKVHGEEGRFTEDSPLEPLDPYGRSKRDSEDTLRMVAAQTGLDVVIVRSPLVYGPGAKANFRTLLTAVRDGRLLPFASIANRRSLVAVDNLADFIATCMEHPAAASQSFLVSDDEDLSTPELVRRLASAVGRTPRLMHVPVWCLRAAGAVTGRSAEIARLTGSLTVDISKARSRLGWVPPVSVDEGLRRAACEP